MRIMNQNAKNIKKTNLKLKSFGFPNLNKMYNRNPNEHTLAFVNQNIDLNQDTSNIGT